jgi:hypothetical protein
VYETQSLPLLKKWNFDVVAHGPSLHDANSYCVIRRFKSLEDREKSEDAFYSSDDWKLGPRDAIMGLVEHFAYTVVSVENLGENSGTDSLNPNRNACVRVPSDVVYASQSRAMISDSQQISERNRRI